VGVGDLARQHRGSGLQAGQSFGGRRGDGNDESGKAPDKGQKNQQISFDSEAVSAWAGKGENIIRKINFVISAQSTEEKRQSSRRGRIALEVYFRRKQSLFLFPAFFLFPFFIFLFRFFFFLFCHRILLLFLVCFSQACHELTIDYLISDS
jgi:hypothetical protein